MMEVNGVSYHLETIGDGPTPILWLHGFTGTGNNIKEALTFFENQGEYTFILLDFLGHGKSSIPADPGRYSMENTVEDIKVILDRMGIAKISLVGYSMGGRVALAFTATYPSFVEKLVLESASPGLRIEEERCARRNADNRLAMRIRENGVEDFVEYWTSIPLFETQFLLSEDKQRRIKEQRLQNSPVGLANSLLGIGTGSQSSYWESLEDCIAKVLLLAGEKDTKFVRIAENMKNLMKNAVYVKISDAGHAIHVEQPRKFGKIVSEFLSK
ncbi:2-succinyl-6-hydroxy-2,4-cyclohexadiene-1-carboxylate synthase [Bacillus tianshenii]|uniref:2-succinyl-6-hydroxy-2, 4-cyclohexadiene-1-carboxylate synthase n=1 Tax=Sutcliffiella tianshenii TaxID=1463404 RepID=UPI00296B293C|nr:2-succinyl-6-hydroxy-2,4-cyclohexadiene-1-carboxylate synthase [Bacillus tianshenii]